MKTHSLETPPNYSPMDIRYNRNQDLGSGSDFSAPAMPPTPDAESDIDPYLSSDTLEGGAPPSFPEEPDLPESTASDELHANTGQPPPINSDGTLANFDTTDSSLEGGPPDAPDSPSTARPSAATGQFQDDGPPPVSSLIGTDSMQDPSAALGLAAPPPASQLQLQDTQPPDTGSVPTHAQTKTSPSSTKQSRSSTPRTSKKSSKRTTRNK